MIVPAENTRYYTVAADDGDVSAVAAKNGLSAAELRALNPALAEMKEGEDLKEGLRLAVSRGEQMLTVKTVTTEVVKENTPFETVEVKSDSLYIGTSRVVVKGQKGFDQITNLVTYLGGVRVRSEEVSRISVKEPVAQTLQVGTRALDSSYVIATSYGGILLWPAVGTDHINSDYGYRWGKLHAALDIGSTVGTSLGKTVVAAAGGTVVISGVHSSYGYYVKIDHGNGLQTLYAHCMAGSLMVSVGQKVAAGQPIARVGQTGYATGPHLHFEVIVNGVRVDPKPYLGLV
jgi:murein DD-endopeptidase MepM/ murein hydrolase activator NlpD